MTRQDVIRRLSGFNLPEPKVLVADQDVTDIMDGVVEKHKECVRQYDLIYKMFDADGSWDDVAQRLFNFCKEQIVYSVESVEWQYVQSPKTLMTRAVCDCKGYALFIAGVIDGMKRSGEKVVWCYRFASYKLFNSIPAHVFVVLFPGTTGEIWIDPVLDNLNQRSPSPIYKTDIKVSTCRPAAVGFVGGSLPGTSPYPSKLPGTSLMIGSAEDDLLASVKQYSDGISNSIVLSQQSGTINVISQLVLLSANAVVPGISAAINLMQTAVAQIDKTLPAGSEAGLLLADYASNPLLFELSALKTLFKGRTYNTDQYWAAQYYRYYVLGQSNIVNQQDCSDSDIMPALKWFIDRTGVFISGRQHILALVQGPAAYTGQYSVNSDTTLDPNRVAAACNVAQAYFIQNAPAGSWADTIGVYDEQLVQIALSANETVEAAAAQAGYSGVYSSAATSGANPVSNGVLSNLPVIPLLAVAIAAIIIFIPEK